MSIPSRVPVNHWWDSEDVRVWIVARASKAGSVNFGSDRECGRSANAMVTHVLMGDPISEWSFPADTDDLRACINTVNTAPDCLKRALGEVLEVYTAHVAVRYPKADVLAEARALDYRGIPINRFVEFASP